MACSGGHSGAGRPSRAALGVDVGGTFTDVALWDGSDVTVGKVLTTPRDQSEGVMAGAATVLAGGGGGVADLLHGTTVATNALLERRGAKTLLATSAGFESLVEIARQDRPSLYDPYADRARPLVESDLRVGLNISDGATEAELDEITDGIAELAIEQGVGAVAVCMMYSYADPALENRISERLRQRFGRSETGSEAAIPVSASAEVVAEFREYERFSTAVVNAFLAPEVARYMAGMAERSERSGRVGDISVMRSSGGLVSLDYASRFPASILLSGPAGGVVACAALGEQMDCGTLISFDMGGTSTDVCRVLQGRPQVIYNRDISGHACLMPSVAVHTVGAGGGSVAWADSGSALRVGPRSAGASPGPACYARGGDEPTVTDANLVLGRLDPSAELAGAVRLRSDLASAACGRLGEELSLDSVETALGVLSVVESHMTRAVRAVSVEQGTDPRDAVLVAFGGAGGLHATALARSLGMRGVVIPPYAGVFSAFGLLLSAPRVDLAQTVSASSSDFALLESCAERLLASAEDGLEADSGQGAHTSELVADMRYEGQAYELSTPYELGEQWDSLCEKFHRLHAQRNGFSLPGEPVEAVTLRAEAVGLPALRWADLPEFVPETGDPKRPPRTVVVPPGAQAGAGLGTGGAAAVTAEVWWRPALPPGTAVTGPAIIEDGESTTFIAGGERARVHETGALRIDW